MTENICEEYLSEDEIEILKSNKIECQYFSSHDSFVKSLELDYLIKESEEKE